jgi:hypothetical protein
MLATALLIRRGLAGNVKQAEALLRRIRPGVRMNREQKRWLRGIREERG